MKELSQHIEALLLKHDCVIVPGLGGFVTHYVPARRVAEENIFLPPYRSVGFNAQLVLNDGLLAQSFMQTAGVGYAEACKLVAAEVADVKRQLAEQGECELPGIGTLRLGADGAYDFTPNEAGVVSPELYGLDALSVKRLDEVKTAQPARKHKAKALRIKRNERGYTLSISRELVNYAAAVAVALICYFVWATPVSNNADGNRQAAALVYEQLFDIAHQATAQATQSTAPQPAPAKSQATANLMEAPIAPEPAQAEATQTAKSAAPKVAEATAPTKEGGYTLVLASSVPRKSAEAYAAKLRQSGYGKAEVYAKGRMVRVVYGHYASQSEAQQALNSLRSSGKTFADAWVIRR